MQGLRVQCTLLLTDKRHVVHVRSLWMQVNYVCCDPTPSSSGWDEECAASSMMLLFGGMVIGSSCVPGLAADRELICGIPTCGPGPNAPKSTGKGPSCAALAASHAMEATAAAIRVKAATMPTASQATAVASSARHGSAGGAAVVEPRKQAVFAQGGAWLRMRSYGSARTRPESNLSSHKAASLAESVKPWCDVASHRHHRVKRL